MPQRGVGWQPSRFLTDRTEAKRAYALAEQLGSVNAAATQLGTTWPSLRKAFTRHGLACPPATLKPFASGPSPQPVNAAASQPPRRWTRCLWPSTPAPCRPESGRRLSCTNGFAARSSTPPWEPMLWSSCTAKATPASQPPAPGPSSDEPTAVTGWPANAPATPTAATPTEPTAPTGPTNLRSGGWLPMPADPHRPDQPDREPRLRPTARHPCAGPKLPTRCAGWCSPRLYRPFELGGCRTVAPSRTRLSRGIASRPVSNLVSIGSLVPSSRGRLRPYGPPRPGLGRPAGHSLSQQSRTA
jgi:hypothetical protein